MVWTGSKLMWVMVAISVFSAASGANPMFCNVDLIDMNQCRLAVTGEAPPSPTEQCCDLVHQANLHCLCSFKLLLPTFGINPASAVSLPQKCGMTAPPECQWP